MMRHLKLALALSALSVLLHACGGGGGGGGSSSGGSNALPVANAGTAQTVDAGATVTLAGAGTDSDGTIASYRWTQTAGTAVTLTSNSIAQPSFVAPSPASQTTLTFSLTVTDNRGATSSAATVDVTVRPAVIGNVTVSGTVRFARVGFSSVSPFGLDYGNAQLQPSRGVVVRALDAGTLATLATGTTSSTGTYSLTVAGNTSILIEVVARLLKTGAAPTWDVRVQDGTSGDSPYTYRTAAFSSGGGITQNIDMPTGISAAAVVTGNRDSGPFAILDTVYTAQQAVIGVSPNIVFPPLIVNWGPSQTSGTFYSPGSPQYIALLSDVTEDTDEFDRHVIAHEFGHYLEHNFSRADNIGGSHGLGDRLDARVAFGEGWGYAFAAIVLNDPIARDSFVNTTPINGTTLVSGAFDIEANPSTTPPLSGRDREGCWCSESSVWSILYDLFDANSDTNDSLSLGLQPLWNVLIGDQKTTPGFTTIFSFITALKAARPADAAAIDTLVSAQNIDVVGMDVYGTGETHFPNSPSLIVAPTAALPVYTTATLGVPLVLRNVDDAGRYNKLGNHRYVRFTVPSTRTVTITLATTNTTDNDPDFLVFRAGATFVNSGEGPPPGPETGAFTLSAGDYLLDIYDCANGCSTAQGTSGDYDLTLTIN